MSESVPERSLNKNTAVLLMDLSVTRLNNSVGLILIPSDPATGRCTVKWKTASDAVLRAYPNGVKILSNNSLVMTKLCWDVTISDE
jgi:hypothetical protein